MQDNALLVACERCIVRSQYWLHNATSFANLTSFLLTSGMTVHPPGKQLKFSFRVRRGCGDFSLVLFTPHRVKSRRPHRRSSARLNLGLSKTQAQHHSIRFHFGHSAMVHNSLTRLCWLSQNWRGKRLLIHYAGPTRYIQTCPHDTGKHNRATPSDDIESRKESVP